jgi:carbon-monoxide dehydrogenase medium subunit
MHPGEFAYHRPASLDEAVSLLGSGDGARPLAGGHSLLPLMKLRFTTPTALVDLARIPGLDAIEADGDGGRIGAMVTHAAVASSDAVASRCLVLAETAAGIGDRQVRNRGTIGGSVAHADPGADYPTVLTALGATIVVTGGGGEREIAAGDFFRGPFTTALAEGELVTAVRVPGSTGAAYVKHRHPASGYAVAGAAAVIANGSVRVAIGGVTGAPVLVTGGTADEAAGAVAGALGDASIGDSYASTEYRVHLANVLAKRALAAATERAQG